MGREPALPRLGDLLREATAKLGMPAPEATGRLWSRWTEVVGAAVAAHAEPTSLRGGVLKIRADSPAWATEISYLADEIRRRANDLAGGALVAEVRVWTGPGRPPAAPAGKGRGEPTKPPLREAPVDPAEALARARAAWEKRRS